MNSAARWLGGAFLLAGVAFHVAVVFTRGVNFDEHVFLHMAWLRALGEYDGGGFFSSHPGLSRELFRFVLGPDPDPVISLTWARIGALGLAFAQALALWMWARRSVPALAEWAPGLFLTADVITYSISELRVDAAASAWTILAWTLMARGCPAWLCGLLLGIPGAENQKHVLVLALGVLHLWRVEGFRAAVTAALAGTVPVGLQLAHAAWHGVLPGYWLYNYGLISAVSGEAHVRVNLLLLRDIVITAPHLVLLPLPLLGKGFQDLWAGRRSDEGLLVTAIACGVLFIVTAPYPNQYNLLPLLPPLIIAACRGAASLIESCGEQSRRRERAAALLLFSVLIFHVWLPLQNNLFILFSNEVQRQREETAMRHSLIPPGETYLDGAGLTFRRSPAPFWHLTLTVHAAARAMPRLLPDIPRILREKRCRFVALNDFTTPLPQEMVAFMRSNYRPMWEDLHVLGVDLGSSPQGSFEVVIPGVYGATSVTEGGRKPAGAGLLVDGAPWDGDRRLEVGAHSFTRSEAGAALELIAVRTDAATAGD